MNKPKKYKLYKYILTIIIMNKSNIRSEKDRMEELKERKEQKLKNYIQEILINTWMEAEALSESDIMEMASKMANAIINERV